MSHSTSTDRSAAAERGSISGGRANSAGEPSAPRPANFPRQGDVHEQLRGPNFSLARIGKPSELARYGVRHPALRDTVRGKLFLKEVLDLTALEISYGLLPPQRSIPFYHKHQQNEEVYLFLSGAGDFQVDGQVVAIEEGTAVRVAPDGVRAWRNTSDEPMFYIVIQAKSGSLQQWTGSDGLGVPGEVQWPAAG
jgi:mannose-6-phosphate isomerase-like protein (cupin superfamily)